MQNSLEELKSTRDEALFPFIGSIAIPCSTSYRTSGMTSFRKLQRFLRYQSQVYMNINFSTATRGKLHTHHIIPRWELIPCLWLKRWSNFPQATQEQFSLNNTSVRGTLCFLSQEEWTPRGPDSNKGRISLQWLKFRLVFHLTRWRHVWVPCGNPRESCRSLLHLNRGLTSLWDLERHTEFNAS